MKNKLLYGLITSLYLISFIAVSQEKEDIKSIKIEKEKQYLKAVFDETEFKVIAIDKYGNPYPEAIKSFCVFYKEDKTSYQAPIIGNTFPKKTIDFLTKKKKFATKICLTNLKAEDKNGHLEDLPDLCDIVIFPDCKKVNHKK